MQAEAHTEDALPPRPEDRGIRAVFQMKGASISRASCERMREQQTEERIRQTLHDLDRDPVEEIIVDYLCRLRRIAGVTDPGEPF